MMTVNPGAGPPVVFISQLGVGGVSWKPVIDLLTSSPTTVAYDRPGTGNAPPRPAPNPALPFSAFADELAVLLDEHGVTEPAVLIGHSVGSLIARVFADRHLGRVAGMVHLDGSIPRLNLWPAIDELEGPDGDGPAATAFDLVAGEVEVLDARVPPVPAVVVSRTPGNWPRQWNPDQAQPLWHAYQRQLARQWAAPRVLAAEAGHQIPADAPRLVAYVIDTIVQAVRSGEPWKPDPAALAAAGGTLDPDG